MEVAAVDMPPWTRHFVVPGLELLEEKRARLLVEIRHLEEALASVDHEIQARRGKSDCLLAGEGEQLTHAVMQTLDEIGAQVEPLGEGEACFALRTRGGGEHPQAIVGVVGCEGAVERRHVRALGDALNDAWERWGDPRPKGLLVANAFHRADPRERNGVAFPQELHSFCRQNDICLLTTLQLFNAYFALTTGDLKDGAAFLESLLKTSGEYPKFRNCAQAVRAA